MAEVKPFVPSKLVVGIISAQDQYFAKTEEALISLLGPVDLKSPIFPFRVTDYYDGQMGKNLGRLFIGFARLVSPESLAETKLLTNSLEKKMRESLLGTARPVNIDPGILTRAALFMATAKDFAHRVPLRQGIYAHLELLFSKTTVNMLPWTYPDFRQQEVQKFFLQLRRIYLEQLRNIEPTRY